MKHYTIVFTSHGQSELRELKQVIRDVYQAPLTAQRYALGLLERIKTLQFGAEMYAVIPELSVEYGLDMRRINYKQIAIIYTLEEDKVYIQRVMPAGMVIY